MPKNTKVQKPTIQKKILVGLLMIVVTAPLLFGGFILLAFNGGWQGIKNSFTPAPDPRSSEVVTKRDESKGAIDKTFHELERTPDIANVATGSHDICYEGQANWKHVDNFSNRCAQKFTRFYGFAGDVPEAVRTIDRALQEAGWEPSDYNSAEGWLSDHGSELARRVNEIKHGPRYYRLPNFSYSKDGGNSLATIDFEEKENGVINGYALQWAMLGFSEQYNIQNFQDEDKVYAQIATNYPYAITVSISDIYFQN